jgi:hypothetical protein
MDLNFRLNPFTRRQDHIRNLRRQMIDETSTFLTWALTEERDLPRIPHRRVDAGGFTEILLRPGGRALATRWWSRALETLDKV